MSNIPYNEPVSEPEFKEIDNSSKQIHLKTSAKSDFAKYSTDSTVIFFKPTLMFTSRTHKLRVYNLYIFLG